MIEIWFSWLAEGVISGSDVVWWVEERWLSVKGCGVYGCKWKAQLD